MSDLTTHPKRSRRTGCPLQDEVLAMRRREGAEAADRPRSGAPTSPEPARTEPGRNVEGRGPVPPDRRQALETHLEGCPDCRRAVAVGGALAMLADAGPGFGLPDPGRLYWRARVLERLAERREAVERAARPLRWVHAAGALLAALLGTLLVARLTGGLLGTLEAAADLLGGGVDAAVLQLAVWAGLALLAGAGLLAAHTLVEER